MFARSLSIGLLCLLTAGLCPVSFAEDAPANLTEQDQGNMLPVSMFKGRVTNQASRYILGPDDVLSIKIKDLDQFNQEFSIRPDGYASIHPFGEFYVAGTDIQSLQGWLEDKFKYYLVKPQITVNLKEMRTAQIYVSGAVKHAGTYQFSRDKLNILQSTDNPTQDKTQITLTNVLAKAGGVSLNADISNIQVIHNATGQKEVFNLRDLLEGKAFSDLWLLPEDSVIVPAMQQPMDPETFKLVSSSTFFRDKFPVIVLGEVQHQGEVQVDPTNNTMNAAIALAGGFISNVSKRDKIIVQRPNSNGGFSRWVIDREKSNLALQPGDVLYITNSKTANVQHIFQVLNSIAQPYYFSLNGANVIKNGLFTVK